MQKLRCCVTTTSSAHKSARCEVFSPNHHPKAPRCRNTERAIRATNDEFLLALATRRASNARTAPPKASETHIENTRARRVQLRPALCPEEEQLQGACDTLSTEIIQKKRGHHLLELAVHVQLSDQGAAPEIGQDGTLAAGDPQPQESVQRLVIVAGRCRHRGRDGGVRGSGGGSYDVTSRVHDCRQDKERAEEDGGEGTEATEIKEREGGYAGEGGGHTK